MKPYSTISKSAFRKEVLVRVRPGAPIQSSKPLSASSKSTDWLKVSSLQVSALGRQADITHGWRHFRYVPCVDGSPLARAFFTFAAGSVQPCVRPVCAAHMAAGHNALRGSGPGQKPAFDHALAQVGCPDRRIDRHCITCCSPSQPSHHAGFRP
jgi:hypothetical protein